METITQYPGGSTFAGPESGAVPGYVRPSETVQAGGFSPQTSPGADGANRENAGGLLREDWHRIQLAAIAQLDAGELQGWADLVTGGKYAFRRDPFPGEIAALLARARELNVTLGEP